MVASQLSTNATAAFAASKMPLDDNKQALRGQQPPPPRLAKPTIAKNGPYVAPRLAGSPASSPDVGRKTPGNARPGTSPRRETPSPVKMPLIANVTPRSGARRNRPGSTSSTPNGTPTGTPPISRPLSMVAGRAPSADKAGAGGAGIGIHGVGLHAHSRSNSVVGSLTGAPRGASPERLTKTTSATGQSSPMFFHASDAPALTTKKSLSSMTQAKPNAFFYANGGDERHSPVFETAQTTLSTPTPAKFFHANGLPDNSASPTHSRNNSASSASRTAPKVMGHATPGRPATTTRSSSPLKEIENVPQQNAMDSRAGGVSRTASYVTIPPSQSRPISSGSSLDLGRLNGSRPHVALPYQGPQSISSGITADTCGRISDASSSFISEPESLEHAPPRADAPTFQPMSPTSPLVSPTHSALGAGGSSDAVHSKFEQVQALAAQARRERKVLDLEISNSSLLAINRTLEREMRKQRTELRRYKRMTSSGRISLPPLDNAGRHSLAETTASGLEPIDGSDEEIVSEEDISDDDSSISSPTSSVSGSPSVESEAASRRREKDAKRLRLDLARHRALLADSQALNQSLKRCLGRTEALISEGRRALEHKVRISEVHLGGRVLDVDEMPEGVEFDAQRKGLLSPGLEAAQEGKEYRWETPPEDKAAESPVPASPRSPFGGIVPFVRQMPMDVFGSATMTTTTEDRGVSASRGVSPTRLEPRQPLSVATPFASQA